MSDVELRKETRKYTVEAPAIGAVAKPQRGWISYTVSPENHKRTQEAIDQVHAATRTKGLYFYGNNVVRSTTAFKSALRARYVAQAMQAAGFTDVKIVEDLHQVTAIPF
jgi:hypothetical protein